MDITFYLFFMALLVSFAAWCVFLWAIRTGQFHEVEDIKYQLWPRSPEESEPERREATRASQPSQPAT
jgi:cbb3-type cytochrome oxidase maturation protein